MIINVNLKHGKQQIDVYEGDTADILTEEFCRKHNITDENK